MGEKNNISTELEESEVLPFGKRDFNAYNRLMANIEKGFTKASDAYVLISCNLWQIYHNEYYRIDNYKSIADFAFDKYEIKKSTTHNYIKVMEKFGDISDGKALGLKEEYKAYKCSQLINMLTFTPEQIEHVSPDWTIKQIVAFGKGMSIDTSGEEPEEDVEYCEDDSSYESSEDMNIPEIEVESGRTFLLSCEDLEEIFNSKEKLLSAFNDMKQDKNFQNKCGCCCENDFLRVLAISQCTKNRVPKKR